MNSKKLLVTASGIIASMVLSCFLYRRPRTPKRINAILIGPPYVGKAVLVAKIQKEFPHVDAFTLGDLGLPKDSADAKVSAAVEQRILRHKHMAKAGFLVKGFPRNITQAQSFERFLQEQHAQLNVVILISNSDDQAILDDNLAASPERLNQYRAHEESLKKHFGAKLVTIDARNKSTANVYDQVKQALTLQ